jgi:hypothetical protein
MRKEDHKEGDSTTHAELEYDETLEEQKDTDVVDVEEQMI